MKPNKIDMATDDTKFEVKGLIGQGAFGKVFLVENKKHEKVKPLFSLCI